MNERRIKAQRRWEPEAEFPLRDSSGYTVISDRRRVADRRLENISFEDRMIGFSEMPVPEPERKKKH